MNQLREEIKSKNKWSWLQLQPSLSWCVWPHLYLGQHFRGTKGWL